MSAVNEQGNHVTTVGKWNVTLHTDGPGPSIICEIPGSKPILSLGVDALAGHDLTELYDLGQRTQSLLKLDVPQVNALFDWIRVNLPDK